MFFIRMRTYQTKKHGIRESYRVIETYVEAGKKKQRVICNLGHHATPELALEKEKKLLERETQDIEEGRYRFHKFRHSIEEIHKKHIKRVEKLEAAVAKMCAMGDILDTTQVDAKK